MTRLDAARFVLPISGCHPPSGPGLSARHPCLCETRSRHAGAGPSSLDALYARYRGLVGQVISKLRDGDTELAVDLSASSEQLWSDLADPRRFATLARS